MSFTSPFACRFRAPGPPAAPHSPTAGAESPLLRQRQLRAPLPFLPGRVRPGAARDRSLPALRGAGLPLGTLLPVGESFPREAPRSSCQSGGFVTHFTEGAPRVLPRRAGGRGVKPTPDPGVARGGPSDGLGVEGSLGPAGVLCWGMNWKMRLGGKSDRVPSPGFNPLCPWGSSPVPRVRHQRGRGRGRGPSSPRGGNLR